MEVHKSQGFFLKWLHPYLLLPNTMCWVGGRDRLNRLFRQNSFKITRFYVKTTCRTTVLVSFQFRPITCLQLHKMSVYHRSGKRACNVAVQWNSPTEAKSSFAIWFIVVCLANKLLSETAKSICWVFLVSFVFLCGREVPLFQHCTGNWGISHQLAKLARGSCSQDGSPLER